MPKHRQAQEPEDRPELKDHFTRLGDGSIVIRGKGVIAHGEGFTRLTTHGLNERCIEYEAGQGALAQGYKPADDTGPSDEVEYELRIKPKPQPKDNQSSGPA